MAPALLGPGDLGGTSELQTHRQVGCLPWPAATGIPESASGWHSEEPQDSLY